MPEPDPALRAILGKPFVEQVAALRLRLGNLVPTARWDDIRHSAHDHAFMVAGAAKADLLADLAGAVDRAIADGGSLEAFRRDFRDIVQRHGWHGWTGEGTAAGEAWRTRVIYRTNAATSYAAGRMAQLVEAGYPLWIYHHGGSREPRPHHLALDGVTLPPDHPFWKTHATPNGWGCSCYITGARSPAAARRRGGDPDKALPQGWNRIDPRTGAPVGIDRGWDYAPGASVSGVIRDLAPKLEKLPEALSVDLIQSWLRSERFGKWIEEDGDFPLVRLPAEDAEAIGSRERVAALSRETMAKQIAEHPELTAFDYAEAQRVVSEATRRVQDGPHTMVYVMEPEDAGGYVLVVKATRTGRGLFVTSYRRLSADQAIRDRTVRRLLRKGRVG